MNRPSSTAEAPMTVRRFCTGMERWIGRLPTVWVDGQITQINRRPGSKVTFLTLRDTAADVSVPAKCFTRVLDALPTPVQDGDRVIVHGRCEFYTQRGQFSLHIGEIRHVGIGELLARIARLRQALLAEGLFDPRRKRPPPFLPRRIGLITGRGGAAEHDVLEVARARWSAVAFEIRNTPVQGPTAVPQILTALADLDADPRVDVIILARGGGSVEDLLPFSDETLCRAIAACTTPIISAIGHETDSPLSDHVADVRAATPTDAAKRVVPDEREERRHLTESRQRLAGALRNWVARERRGLQSARSRPALADPYRGITRRREEVGRLGESLRRDVRHRLQNDRTHVDSLAARLATLGPAATMARGYSIVQAVVAGTPARIVQSVDEAPPGTQLRVRLADGALSAAVMGATRLAPGRAPREGETR